MIKEALIDILHQEQQQLAEKIAEEQRRPAPDRSRLGSLRHELTDLRRQLEQIPDA